MIRAILALTVLLATFPHAASAQNSRSCSKVECPAGTIVRSAPKSDGVFAACRTEELSNYTNLVLMFVAMQVAFGVRANIDPKTGEPEYMGESKEMLDTFRNRAGVANFDQAMRSCQLGPYGQRLEVINFKKDRLATWVYQPSSKKTFWVPTVSLYPQK